MRATAKPNDMWWNDDRREYKRHWYPTYESAEKAYQALKNLKITTKRIRASATQGEVQVYFNNQYILNFADKIELIHEGDDYYGELISGWASKKPDSNFALGLIWHPLDNVYHYSDMIKHAFGIN